MAQSKFQQLKYRDMLEEAQHSPLSSVVMKLGPAEPRYGAGTPHFSKRSDTGINGTLSLRQGICCSTEEGNGLLHGSLRLDLGETSWLSDVSV